MSKPSIPVFPCAAEPYLPHSAPMALIDSVLSYEPGFVVTTVAIHAKSPFAGHTGVPVWIGIEYMAQTIAAYAGLQAVERGESVKIGFLVSTRSMNCAVDQFDFGMLLRIEARQVIVAAGGLATFDAVVAHDDQEMVSARINVFQPENPTEFLYGEGAA